MSNDNSNWEIVANYDYRFLGMLAQAKHNGEQSPPFMLRLAPIIAQLKPHEIAACLDEANGIIPSDLEGNIEAARMRVLEQTDWKNKVVLDIGGYDGFAAKIAVDGGASRAVCLDNHQYEHYGWEDKKKEGVEYIQGDFMSFFNIPDMVAYNMVDIIINYNVLYHVKNPWAFLDRCREVIKSDGEMLLCTLFRYHNEPWVYLYEPRECNPSDDTVYWGFSLKALERILKATGWDYTLEGWAADRVVYRCKPTPGFTRTHEDT